MGFMVNEIKYAKTAVWSFKIKTKTKKQMVYTKKSEHARINTKKQMQGRRTTFDTTPMASHTVTLLSCEACINERGGEEGGGGVRRAGGLQGVR